MVAVAGHTRTTGCQDVGDILQSIEKPSAICWFRRLPGAVVDVEKIHVSWTESRKFDVCLIGSDGAVARKRAHHMTCAATLRHIY